jgi:hypothetical protein
MNTAKDGGNMSEKNKPKRAYVNPAILNLSGRIAAGQVDSTCVDGSLLTLGNVCTSGTRPQPGGVCNPTGGLAGADQCLTGDLVGRTCGGGSTVATGYCDLGNSAVEGCESGGVHF